MTYALREKQICLASYQTVYLEGGVKTDSEPILFLHGWTISIEPYQQTLQLLCQHYHVIAPDLPGFGKTITPTFVADYDGYINCIIDFLKALDLQKVHVVGHSGGGAVGVALAAAVPTMVSSLIIIDSTGIPLGFLPEVVLRRLIDLPAQVGELEIVPTIQFIQALIGNSLSKPQNMLQAIWLALEKDLRPLLPQVKCSTLIVWGDRDLFVPVKFADDFARGIVNSQVMILAGEYHESIFYRSQKYVTIICNFLQKSA